MTQQPNRSILIFVGDDYEDLELQVPKYRLLEAGYQVVVAGQQAGATYHGKHGYPQKSQADVATLEAASFTGVVVPGGWMPDKLRRDVHVLRLVRDISAANKLVASICHGPWIEISAGIVRGVNYTSTPGIKDDLVNAGAIWHDQPVVVDNKRVSSRRPDDLPDFCRALLQVLDSQAK